VEDDLAAADGLAHRRGVEQVTPDTLNIGTRANGVVLGWFQGEYANLGAMGSKLLDEVSAKESCPARNANPPHLPKG
jgi:hypothetical protein